MDHFFRDRVFSNYDFPSQNLDKKSSFFLNSCRSTYTSLSLRLFGGVAALLAIRAISPNSNTKPPREYKTPPCFRGSGDQEILRVEILRDPTREYKPPLVFEGLENKGGFCIRVRTDN